MDNEESKIEESTTDEEKSARDAFHAKGEAFLAEYRELIAKHGICFQPVLRSNQTAIESAIMLIPFKPAEEPKE